MWQNKKHPLIGCLFHEDHHKRYHQGDEDRSGDMKSVNAGDQHHDAGEYSQEYGNCGRHINAMPRDASPRGIQTESPEAEKKIQYERTDAGCDAECNTRKRTLYESGCKRDAYEKKKKHVLIVSM